jgi:hypothetical protein
MFILKIVNIFEASHLSYVAEKIAIWQELKIKSKVKICYVI